MIRKLIKSNLVSTQSVNKQVENVPLVATYHLPLNGLNKTLIDKLHPLHPDQEVKEKLPIKPKVSSEVLEKIAVILSKLKYTPLKEKSVHVVSINSGAKYVLV